MGKTIGTAAAVFLLAIGQAGAAGVTFQEQREGPAALGTLAYLPGNDWAQRMTEPELAEYRGGFGGVSFSAFFAVFDSVNASVASLNASTPGVEILSSPSMMAQGSVEAFTQAGVNLPANFTGIAQMANVVGDFNVVNQGVFIHLNMINVTDAASAANVANLLSSTQGMQPQ